MTPKLEEAFRAAQELPEAEQDAIAADVLARIRDDRIQAAVFARSAAIFDEMYGTERARKSASHDLLAEMAEEALVEDLEGRTLLLDPERM